MKIATNQHQATWRGAAGELMGPTHGGDQLPLPFYGKVIDVDGMRDSRCEGITYWGKATCVFDDVYRCLANVGGTLCVVEITVTTLEDP